MSNIQIEKLQKNYGSFEAIAEMNLTIPDGSFCVFLGPSGSGKSTTLNCIAGLEEASSGTIRIGDDDVTNLPPHQRDIAMVFQSSLLYPHLTALQNIKMSLKNSKISACEAQQRIEHAIAILEIESELSKKPNAMSGGQRQRVAMAKAIVRNPSVFLMDEPLAALDAALRQTLRTELVTLQKKLGTTTIFVTHDQIEAMTMGDLIVVMNEGRVEQVGTPNEIYNQPATRFVAGFIGSPPMNFIDGTIQIQNGKPVLTTLNGEFSLPKHLVPKTNDHNKPISLGVRPHNLQIATQASTDAIKAEVSAIENLGKEANIILLDEQKQVFRCIVSADHSYKIGDFVSLVPDFHRAHLFT